MDCRWCSDSINVWLGEPMSLWGYVQEPGPLESSRIIQKPSLACVSKQRRWSTLHVICLSPPVLKICLYKCMYMYAYTNACIFRGRNLMNLVSFRDLRFVSYLFPESYGISLQWGLFQLKGNCFIPCGTDDLPATSTQVTLSQFQVSKQPLHLRHPVLLWMLDSCFSSGQSWVPEHPVTVCLSDAVVLGFQGFWYHSCAEDPHI